MDIVIFGNDHTNTIGLLQSLGKAGYRSTGLLFGKKTGFVKSSKYTKRIITGKNPQECIDKLVNEPFVRQNRIPIIAGCDIAALTLERNKERLREKFVFEYSSNFSLEYLSQKKNQVRLASDSGFNVPKTWVMSDLEIMPSDIIYPCLIKPLISCEGAKCDILVCKDKNELHSNIRKLKVTKRVLLQQYIERDYEISILGCALSNGDCLIPAVENKLTLYPKYVGLECLADVQKLTDEEIITCVKSLISSIGYVGLFSVEMMHCKIDNKFYFTEINLRNDGAEAFITKYGANLPLNHVEDLMGLPLTKQIEERPGYYIWEIHHLMSMVSRDMSIIDWLKEIKMSKGFLCYDCNDKRPFFKQFTNLFLKKIHLIREEDY